MATQQPRVQVTISEAVRDYLELKSKLSGKPVATLLSDLAFEAMRTELPELIQLDRVRSKATNENHDKS